MHLFGGCLQEPKPILRYALDECLNVWINEDGKITSYTTWRMLQKTTTKLKFLPPWKPVLRFWIMSVQVLILLWKYLLVKEEEFFYWWKVSTFLLAALFANMRGVYVSKFRVENTAILTPTTKADILTFLQNTRLFARTTHIRLLIYLNAIYRQKMKEIDFSTLATRWLIFPDCHS